MKATDFRALKAVEMLPLVDGKRSIISIKGYNGETAATYAISVWSNKLEFVIVGPTYMSLDGEYRRYMLLPDDISKIIDSQEYEDAYSLIIDEFTQGNLIFHADLFNCSQEVEAEIANSRLPLSLFIICWMMFGDPIKENTLATHANLGFIKLFDIPITAPTLSANPTYGAKLTPMTNGSELMLAAKANGLILDGICYGVPLTLQPIFIPDAHAGLFDNFVSHKKYQLAAAIDAIRKRRDIKSEFHPMRTEGATLVLTEDVGDTLYDFLADNSDINGIIFDIAYTLLCLHSKVGILHADLHLRNCTVINRGSTSIRLLEDTYLRPAGPRGSIIDFSRSISWEETHKLEKLTGFETVDVDNLKDATAGENGSRELYFKLVSIVDMEWFLLKLHEVVDKNYIKEMYEWCKNMRHHLEKAKYNSVNEFEWPMQEFIDKYFAELKGVPGKVDEEYDYNKPCDSALTADWAPVAVKPIAVVGGVELEGWMLY
jgi:hypothetical protein